MSTTSQIVRSMRDAINNIHDRFKDDENMVKIWEPIFVTTLTRHINHDWLQSIFYNHGEPGFTLNQLKAKLADIEEHLLKPVDWPKIRERSLQWSSTVQSSKCKENPTKQARIRARNSSTPYQSDGRCPSGRRIKSIQIENGQTKGYLLLL